MSSPGKLGEILVRYYRIPESTVEGAASAQGAVGVKLGDVLVEIGVLSENDLARALAFQHRVPVALNLARATIDPEILQLIPPVIAAWEKVVPIKCIDGTLLVAMEDPNDASLLAELEALTGFRVQPAIAAASDLREAVRRFYAGGEVSVPDEDDDEDGIKDTQLSNAVLPMSPSCAPTEAG